MTEYDKVREKYKPAHIKYLIIAESPPPPPDVQSSRQFYYTDRIRKDDRLFVNTIQALFEDAANLTETELEIDKEKWLHRFKNDGWFMIEALEDSQVHKVTKKKRQEKIKAELPHLIEKIKAIVNSDTKIILLKSNVFEVAAEPLRVAGFDVLNNELVDYPGIYNRKAYRQKLSALVGKQK